MGKLWVFSGLFVTYILYSLLVYTRGTENEVPVTEEIQKGKMLFQKHNCISCHQLYGLGGYIGPELTTAYSDPARGEQFMRAFLQAGGRRMPNFHLKAAETEAIIAYLKYIDETAVSYKIRKPE